MGQIKFRGLTKGGTWLYGDLVQYRNETKAIIGKQLSASGYLSVEGSRITLVKAETVGRFTGLKDIDANDVFDGDCIEYKGLVSHVFWSDSDFGFVTFNKILNEYTGLSFFTGYKNFKIVGNIHQNPELLED